MLKALLRLALLAVILVGVGGFFLGWWSTSRSGAPIRDEVGTTGTDAVEKARDTTAEMGDRAAAAASQAKTALEDGGLTAKIKSKMALDDTVKAYDIDVDTKNRVVTLTGTVNTEAQRERALLLARETEGVRNVVDRLKIVR